MKRRSFVVRGLSSLAVSSLPGFSQLIKNKPIEEGAIAAFAKRIKGSVYLPGTAEYKALGHHFAAKVDLHPALIVHVTGTDDVSQAVQFAKRYGLPLAVRGGGHSYAGYNSCEGGVVIDLSALRELTISPDQNTVRIGGGMLSGLLEQATAKVGRAAVLGQCPGVGVGGFLLGGGVGPLMSKYGLGCDNVLSAEVVLADARQVTASAHHNPDLFWAIRGGGGNFGVVTSFTLALHPVSQVLGGYLTYASSDVVDLLHVLKELAALATDELTLIATLSPNEKGKYELSVQACYAGDMAEGEKLLAPMRRSRFLVADSVKRLAYIDLESQVPVEIPPAHNENRGAFFADLNDGVIAVLAEAAATAPGFFEFAFLHLHGAVTRIPLHATAFPLRSNGFGFGVMCFWKPSAGPKSAADWVTSVAARLAPFGRGAYVNVMDRENSESVRNAYVENYPRLAKLKARYDPSNLFSINQNIKPAG